MDELQCETCPRMDYGRMKCSLLNHPLESGYAMRYHSQFCGRNPSRKRRGALIGVLLLLAGMCVAGSTRIIATTRHHTNDYGNVFFGATAPIEALGATGTNLYVWLPFEAPTLVNTQRNYGTTFQWGWTNDARVVGCTYSNRCMHFDGIDDYISITNVAWTAGAASFTISMWATFYDVGSARGLASWNANKASSLASAWFALNAYLGWRVHALCSDNGSSWAIVVLPAGNPVALPIATWQHYALTRDNASFYVYTNGVRGSATADDSALYSGGTGFFIGGLWYGATPPNSPMKGGIDDVLVTPGKAVWTANFTPPPRSNTNAN